MITGGTSHKRPILGFLYRATFPVDLAPQSNISRGYARLFLRNNPNAMLMSAFSVLRRAGNQLYGRRLSYLSAPLRGLQDLR